MELRVENGNVLQRLVFHWKLLRICRIEEVLYEVLHFQYRRHFRAGALESLQAEHFGRRIWPCQLFKFCFVLGQLEELCDCTIRLTILVLLQITQYVDGVIVKLQLLIRSVQVALLVQA